MIRTGRVKRNRFELNYFSNRRRGPAATENLTLCPALVNLWLFEIAIGDVGETDYDQPNHRNSSVGGPVFSLGVLRDGRNDCPQPSSKARLSVAKRRKKLRHAAAVFRLGAVVDVEAVHTWKQNVRWRTDPFRQECRLVTLLARL